MIEETGSTLKKTIDSRFVDPVIEAYKNDVDRSLLRENLKLTPAQRAEKFKKFMKLCFEIRGKARIEKSHGNQVSK